MNEGEQLLHNLTSHAMSGAQVDAVAELRGRAMLFGAAALALCPPSRERSLALTNLEQSLMWAVASIARQVAE